MDSRADYVTIGVIRRPHGLKGALKVYSFSGETEHFTLLKEVELRRGSSRTRYPVRSVEIHKDTPVIFLDGVEDKESAGLLSGWEVWVPRDCGAPLRDGEYYVRDLIGLNVISDAAPFGTIVAVIEGSQAPLLEIRREGSDTTVLVPFMAPFAGVPHRQSGTVELLTPWIVDTE